MPLVQRSPAQPVADPISQPISVKEFKNGFIKACFEQNSWNSPTAAISEASAPLGDHEQLVFLTKSQIQGFKQEQSYKDKENLLIPQGLSEVIYSYSFLANTQN